MKRQFKAAAVVSTAALLAMGASFTSMAAPAAKTGEWKLEADGWYCLDKNGEAYTNEWCLSYGKEYFVDENGLLATYSWIEDDDKFYFVGSTGAKTVNDWRFITAPYDEDGEEYWFYFDAKGEMETGKKVINGNTYYFDVDGRMLTGWVTYDDGVAATADVYTDAGLTYCDETGARLTNRWLQTFAPGADIDEVEDDDLEWHYIGATGGLTKGKKNDIKGKTYLFDAQGKMLTGWVAGVTGDDNKTVYSSFTGTMAHADNTSYYFCGTADQGYVKKDRWVKTWTPATFADQDEDVTQYWYMLGADGKAFVPDVADDVEGVWDYTLMTLYDGDVSEVATAADATPAKGVTKKVNSKMYLFGSDGRMKSGLVEKEVSGSNAELYYFGGSADGAMKKGNVSIADESGLNFKFYFGEKTGNGYTEGAAVTGAANGYLYIGGQLYTQEAAKYQQVEVDFDGDAVDGRWFVVNNNGAIQTAKKTYKDGSDELFTLGATHNGVTSAEGVTPKTYNYRLKGSYAADLNANANQ